MSMPARPTMTKKAPCARAAASACPRRHHLLAVSDSMLCYYFMDLSLLLHDQRPHVVARLSVVLRVAAIAEREGCALPAAAVHALAAVLDVRNLAKINHLLR